VAHRPGPYQVQAAIAVLHAGAADAGDTDWRQIALLYETLATMTRSPVVELNRAAAIGMADGPAAGLTALDGVRRRHPALAEQHVLHAARAELLVRAGRTAEAAVAYDRAIALVPDGGTDAADLRHRRRALDV
jgi:RNA polymerase sigma-70 factor, ECF subfamily